MRMTGRTPFLSDTVTGRCASESYMPPAPTILTSAAEAGLIEAMEKLYDMYNNGIGVELD